MSRVFGLACLLLVLGLVLPSRGADDDKDAKKDDPATKKVEGAKDKDDDPKKGTDKDKESSAKTKKEKFTWGAELIGKLWVDGNSQKDFKLHVTQKIMEPDYNAQQQYAQQQMQLQRQQMQMAAARTLQARQQALQQYYQTANQLAQTQMRLYKPKDLNFDVELRFGENMKVRLLQPPVEYDDKGNLKKHTAKELQALRGTEDLPGYTGEVDALRSGQYVKVYLAKNQAPPTKVAMGKGGKAAPVPVAAKKKKTDEDEDELGMARPEAVMIMVLQDPLPGN
jgi:hypothetical protein